NAGGFNKMVYAPYRSMAELPVPAGDDTALGRRVYMASCAPCHQANGMGMAGQFPPLAGSEWVLTPGPGRAIRIVLDGVAGPMEVRGVHYNNAMVPWRDNLSDEEIAAVVTFIRNEWGNQASKVTPEQVAELRAATAGRGTYTAEELLRLPDTE
ncbi:MAG: c-type cytochrome, partial [Limisphaerales bacterium]